MTTSSVSIVIPCFNYGRFLADAIQSALAQTYAPAEVLVIDDGSTDNTREVARSFRDSVKYVHQQNRGLPATRNAALGMISGDYVVFLDADNGLDITFLEKTVSALESERDPRVVFVYTQLRVFGLESFVTSLPDYDIRKLKQWNYIDACALIRTGVARRFGYRPQPYGIFEDWDFWLTLAEHGFRGRLLDEPLVHFRKHGSSMLDQVDLTSHVHARIRRRATWQHRRLYRPYELLAATVTDFRASAKALVSRRSLPARKP